MVIQDGRLSLASFRSFGSAMEIELELDEDHDKDASPIDDSNSEQSEPKLGPEKQHQRGTFLPAPTLEQVATEPSWNSS